MYLVFDIGGTVIKYGYLTEQGEIIDKDEFISELTDLDIFIDTLSKIYFESKYEIKGIALSCPGVINTKTGVIKTIVAYPYLEGICLTKMLSKACNGIKVTIENDAKCAGLAEMWCGNGVNYKDAVVIVLGTGIGGVVIKDKKIHHGANLFAGEISNVIVDYDESQCKIVTWSDIASTKALCKRVARVLGIDNINGREIFELVKQKDKKVTQVLSSFCFDIAIQLYNLQYMYDPEIICIGGGISRQEILIDMINDAVMSIYNQTSQLLIPKVVGCKHYNEANLIGALYHHIMAK